jgi:hypothetical protein
VQIVEAVRHVKLLAVAYSAYVNYGICNPAADFNHDGVINSTDQTLFNIAYQNYYNNPH